MKQIRIEQVKMTIDYKTGHSVEFIRMDNRKGYPVWEYRPYYPSSASMRRLFSTLADKKYFYLAF